MKILIKFPTKGRPLRFLQTLSIYHSMIRDKDTKILISCDNDDLSMKQEGITEAIKDIHKNSEIKFGDNKNKVEAINADIAGQEFDILLLASDDMIPVTPGYDVIIKEKMEELYPDRDGVVWFNDGYQASNLNTLPIVGKKYYERFGYIYHPSYVSLWCDLEFTTVANTLGKQTYIDSMIIQHQHPVVPGFTHLNDEVYAANGQHDEFDMKNFYVREKKGFELEQV